MRKVKEKQNGKKLWIERKENEKETTEKDFIKMHTEMNNDAP